MLNKVNCQDHNSVVQLTLYLLSHLKQTAIKKAGPIPNLFGISPELTNS